MQERIDVGAALAAIIADESAPTAKAAPTAKSIFYGSGGCCSSVA
jgi:hypothetical protein